MQDEPNKSILHWTRASLCSAKYTSSVNPVFGRPGGVMELLLQLLSILLALLSLSVHGGFYGSPPARARALSHSLDVQPSQETSGGVWSCGGARGGEGGRAHRSRHFAPRPLMRKFSSNRGACAHVPLVYQFDGTSTTMPHFCSTIARLSRTWFLVSRKWFILIWARAPRASSSKESFG